MANNQDPIVSKISLEEVTGFVILAQTHLHKSEALMSDYFLGYYSKNKNLLMEVVKLYYNSKIFEDYMKKMSNRKPASDGFVGLTASELANITKCVLSLLDSKNALFEYGFTIGLQ